MVAHLVFIMATYFGDSQLVLGEKKLLDATFRGNPLKYPAKYTYIIILANQIKRHSVDTLK